MTSTGVREPHGDRGEAAGEGRAQARCAPRGLGLRGCLCELWGLRGCLCERWGLGVGWSEARKFSPRRAHGYSRDAAADLVPPGCKITKDMKENRWKISAPWMATTKSKSWGTGTQLDDYDAMKFVILVAWSVYTEQTCEPCPHEFAQGDCVAQAPAQ